MMLGLVFSLTPGDTKGEQGSGHRFCYGRMVLHRSQQHFQRDASRQQAETGCASEAGSAISHDAESKSSMMYSDCYLNVPCYACSVYAYTYQSAEADAFLWDHPDFMAVMAAGNDGAKLGLASGTIQPPGMSCLYHA